MQIRASDEDKTGRVAEVPKYPMLCHSSPGCYSPAISHGALRPNPNPIPSFSSANLHLTSPSSFHLLLISPLQVSPSPSSSQPQEFAGVIDEFDQNRLYRRQNARSTAVLRLHGQQEMKDVPSHHDEEDGENLRRQKIIEEVSLATKRIPRFPGSINFPKEDAVVFLTSDDQAFKQALEIRRGVAAEVLKVTLSAGRLSKPYSAKIVSCLPKFIDQVVIEAAEMKVVPEFSHLSFNARAKSYIKRSGVVDLVKWLKHNSLTYPQIGKLTCLCSSNLESVRRLAEWLKTIHVKGKYLGYVLVKASSILEYKLEMLEEIVDYLVEKGVKKEWMGCVVSRCPRVLTLSMAEIESRVKFYMHMGMDEKDFGTMVYDYPKALGFFSMEEMNSKVNYLKEFGLSTEELGRLLAYKPYLMGCSIEEQWKPLVKYLYYLGVRHDGMKRILMAKPVIFCVDLERTIAPKVRFLQDIGVRQEDIGSVIASFPSLLTYSLYKKIRPVVIFLLTKAGVTQENIAKVIAFDPQLVGCSIINKLDVNVKYFLSLGIRLHTIGEMIADFPMLLRYNLNVLRPKYRYLRRIMVRPLQDLIEFPRFFSYSLDGRIIPRHEILVKNHVNFKLRYMLASSDEEFNHRVQTVVENRRKFESGEILSDLSDTEPHQAVPGTTLAPPTTPAAFPAPCRDSRLLTEMATEKDDEIDTNLLSILHENLDPQQEEENHKPSHIGDASLSPPPPLDHRHHLTSINAAIITRELPSQGLSFQLWPAAFSFLSLIDRDPSPLLLPSSSPLRILELGSGTGLVGISIAAILGAHVTLTDLPHVLPNLRFNAIANAEVVAARGGSLTVRQLRWGVVEDIVDMGSALAFDAIVASDVVYYDHLIEPLLETIRVFVKGEVGFLMAHLRRWKKRDAVFFRRAKKFFDVLMVHTDPPVTGSRTGVTIYRFTARRRSPEAS